MKLKELTQSPLYQPANPDLWQGREDCEEQLPAWRWHQKMQCLHLSQQLPPNFTLLGFACHAGVVRNKGRAGAAEGPDALRNALANLTTDASELTDAGTIVCDGDGLEAAQAALASAIEQVRSYGALPVVLGGGHEIAWGSFQGLQSALKHYPRLGIVNFDAHLDLRRPAPAGSSGTPFRQIAHWCETNNSPFHYLVVGANASANTNALWAFAREREVNYLSDITAEAGAITECFARLDQFVAQVDALYLTVCMDVFNAAFAPGVSAPAALGLSPARFMLLFQQLLKLAQRHQKPVLLLDIAELNPRFDQYGQTARLAARIVWEFHRWHRQVCNESPNLVLQ